MHCNIPIYRRNIVEDAGSGLTFQHYGLHSRHGQAAAVRHEIVLGDAAFTAQFAAGQRKDALREVPKAQRELVPPSPAEIEASAPDRDQAMARAYLSGVYTMKGVAEHFGVHYMTVSRAVRRIERMQAASEDTGVLEYET